MYRQAVQANRRPATDCGTCRTALQDRFRPLAARHPRLGAAAERELEPWLGIPVRVIVERRRAAATTGATTMSIRNLDRMFQPKSVAVIGASNRERSVGRVLSRNMLNCGFDGPVLPVNPRSEAIGSTLAYRDVDALPFAPDLAVICTPPDTVPEIGRA